MINVHTSLFMYKDKDSEFDLRFLDKETITLNVGNHSIFMREDQVRQLASAIGKIYWELPVPELEVQDED